LALGLVVALSALEIGLRLIAWTAALQQRQTNRQALLKSGSSDIRILCFGDSTTAIGGRDSFPEQLAAVLAERSNMSWKVFNRGQVGATSVNILASAKSDLEKFRPHIVVAMMGNNDAGIVYFGRHAQMVSFLFRHCRLWRLLQLSAQASNDMTSAVSRLINVSWRQKQASMLVERGFSLLSEGKAVEASVIFRRAASINSWEDRAFIGMGLCYAEQKHFARAESMYKKAVEIKPGNLLMYMESKWGYRIDPRYFYDAEQYRNILADNPALGWALTGLAMYERSVGRNDEARALLERALSNDPGDCIALIEMGMLLCSQNDPDVAEEMFSRAKQADPDSVWPYLGMARAYRMTMYLEGFERECRQAMEKDPGNLEPLAQLSWCYEVQGRYAEAEQLCARALTMAPENYWPWLVRGFCAKLQKDYLTAAKAFSQAIALNPEFINAHMELGMVYMAQGKHDEAMSVFRSAAAAFPQNDRICAALSLLYGETGDLRQQESLRRCAEQLRLSRINPVTATSYLSLKRELDQRGIVLVCCQYPMRSVEPLQAIFGEDRAGVYFVDNQMSFQQAVAA